MSQLPSLSSSNKTERATEADAAEIVAVILGAYPQRDVGNDPVYVGLLTEALIGEPRAMLRKMIDPKYGLIAEKPFLPTLSDVRAFMEQHRARCESHDTVAHELAKQLEDRRADEEFDYTQISPEQWSELGKSIGKAVKHVTIGKANTDRLFERARCGSGQALAQSVLVQHGEFFGGSNDQD